MTSLRDLDPLLLPLPRLLVRSGGRLGVQALHIDGHAPFIAVARGMFARTRPALLAATGAHTRLTLELEAHRQADEHHVLDIDARGISIRCGNERSARHAISTLLQLIAQYAENLPHLHIEDAPAFAVRGVMLDISRDRVPTMAELDGFIEQFASWKINHLQLYTEHTFAYRGHDQVWKDASPITPAEVIALQHHCESVGIELAANQNCFGHLTRWLAHPRYAPLAEIAADGSWDFAGLVHYKGPFSLCPSDPGSLPLIDDLLSQLLPLFHSPLVNIGCDETFDVGQGRSAGEVAKRGRAAVYLEFVAKICAIVTRLGKRPQFWADIALEHPEMLAQLPDGLISLVWGYEPDALFPRWCEQLADLGRETWVCPGTSCWQTITGRTRERRENLLVAASAGIANRARGYLNTAWGDRGHRQQWPITLHGLAEGAHRAWSGTAAYDVRAASLHAWNDESLAIGPWLDALGQVDHSLRQQSGRIKDGERRALRNASALFVDLDKPYTEPWLGAATSWQEVAEALAAFPAAPSTADGLLARELAQTLSEARLAAERGVMRRQALESGGVGTRPALERVQALIAEHRRLWLARSRPGGLDDSCQHYRHLEEEAVAR